MAFKLPKFRDVGLVFIGGLFGFQILSLLASSLFPSIPLFRGGSILLILLVGIAFLSLFILGIKFDELKNRDNIIFVLLTFGLTIAAYYFLPKYAPSIFSISQEISSTIKNVVGSIVGVGG